MYIVISFNGSEISEISRDWMLYTCISNIIYTMGPYWITNPGS
jgi:hypothetical protein